MTTLVVDKRTGTIVDMNQRYDERFYDHREVSVQEAANLSRTKIYQVDQTGAIKEKAIPQDVRGTLYKLNTGQDFSDYHAHSTDQVVIVLHGAVLIDDGKGGTRVEAINSTVIPANMEHKIIGAEDNSPAWFIGPP